VDVRGAIKDEEELVPGLSSMGEQGAGCGVEDSRDLGDTPNLPLAAPVEERHFLEVNLALLLVSGSGQGGS
jgi:hypothetical protein